jgi:three-Cys-motif partner protein
MPTQKIKKKVDVKRNILPHTQAKLDLFKGYLAHYLRVLSHADFCKQISLFDIYCGAGVYDDGKKGSPLLAIDCIRNINAEIINNGKVLKPIYLSVNDYDTQKIESVKSNVGIQDIENCTVEYYNKDANEMLDMVALRVSKYPKDHRNLVFIDPYGYSNISKEKIISLLNNKCTEIILFLPVMQMYRFTEIALIEEKKHYENLRKFIKSFFDDSNNVKTETIFEYIYSIKKALSINDTYFTCSHYIEREKGNYYALFFISSNIYGLEKMLETKWKLDPVRGKGFNQNKNPTQRSLFDEQMKEIDNLREISHLEDVIYQSTKQNDTITNVEIYKLTLKNEFTPKHASVALKNLIAQSKIQEVNNALGYGVNYTNYKNKSIISKFKIL